MTLAALLRHLAFAVALALLSAAVVRLMISLRVPDHPHPRKVHSLATPKGGGVGVVVAFLVGIAVLYRFAEFARLADQYFIGVIEASVAIAVVAFLDDLFDCVCRHNTTRVPASQIRKSPWRSVITCDYGKPPSRPMARKCGSVLRPTISVSTATTATTASPTKSIPTSTTNATS